MSAFAGVVRGWNESDGMNVSSPTVSFWRIISSATNGISSSPQVGTTFMNHGFFPAPSPASPANTENEAHSNRPHAAPRNKTFTPL